LGTRSQQLANESVINMKTLLILGIAISPLFLFSACEDEDLDHDHDHDHHHRHGAMTTTTTTEETTIHRGVPGETTTVRTY
jgi:hypothetical protein